MKESEKLNTLRLSQICCSRNNRLLANQIWVFNNLGSTSTVLKKLPPIQTREGLVCIARLQTNGRGQHSKKWDTSSGTSLTFSLVLEPNTTDRLQLLLQASALSVINVLKQEYSVNSLLKWPNDVLVGGRKICGVLAEGTFLGSVMERFVIGIGINVNGKLSKEINDIAINLESILDRPVDITELFCHLLDELEVQYKRWMNEEHALVTDINKHHRGYGEWNTIKIADEQIDGKFKFLGVDLEGFPVFLNEEDEVNRITRADIRFDPVG